MRNPNLTKFNDLDMFKLRAVTYPCPHFTYTSVTVSGANTVKITDWIEQNTTSRYYMNRELCRTIFTFTMTIGFENPNDLSYLILACPHLN